jgi:hypothetical protein
MSRTLKEFLAEQAEKHHTEFTETKPRREEWVTEVNRLVDQMEGWLREADPDGILDIEPQTVEKREQGLGFYKAKALTMRFGGREVRIHPVARFVVAAPAVVLPLGRPAGRIDITNGESRYSLYRIEDGRERTWFIHNNGPLKRFDRLTFESAVQDLLG